MAQDYDNMAKDLLTDHATDISQFILGVDDVEVLEDLDVEQQIVIAQRTDSTKRVRINNREAILHIELQLRDSTRKPMWARNASYHGYLVGKHELPVYSNVIYFHPSAGRNDTGRYAYRWDDYEYTLRYKVIRLIEVEGQAVLEREASGMLPFAPLMKPPAGMNLERWVQECVDATRTAPVDQKTQADLLYGIYLFGGIVYDSELFERLIPEELMRESKTYQRQREKILRENTIKHISVVLKAKFSADVVNAITPEIQNISDLQRLEELHLAAARVQNIEAFSQMLHE